MTEHPLTLYKAFISHCAPDAAMGDWLARSLRAYKVGRTLRGADTHAGKITAHLGPIFSRAADEGLRPLSGEIVHALFGAQYLIVIVSRHCPRSEQVNKEIRLFKHYHGENRILYVAVGDEGRDRFPEAALYHVDADGALTDRDAHPGQVIEAHSGDGTLLERIVAHLLGVSLDRLAAARKRDRLELRLKWAAVAAALLFVASGLRGMVDRWPPSKAPEPASEDRSPSLTTGPVTETPQPVAVAPTQAAAPGDMSPPPSRPSDIGRAPSSVTVGARPPSIEAVAHPKVTRGERPRVRQHQRRRQL
jgi:MTH538 TIR-like domain (DUF1863)